MISQSANPETYGDQIKKKTKLDHSHLDYILNDSDTNMDLPWRMQDAIHAKGSFLRGCLWSKSLTHLIKWIRLG